MARAMTDVDLAVHRVGPILDEPGIRTCLVCGQAWPCPDRLARTRADFAEQQAQRISDDTRRIGVLVLIERGVSVWSSTRSDAYDQPLGGVVVEIEDVPNPGTGEYERWFTCLDPYGSVRHPVNVRRIAESEVVPSGVEATYPGRMAGLVKRLGLEVHDHKGTFLDPFVAERVRWMYVLTGLSNLAA